MSTLSLPSYTGEPLQLQTPSYSAEPLLHEIRISQGLRHPLATRFSAEFIKDSKRGSLRLRLSGQENNVAIPTFGIHGPVQGTLEVLKPEGLAFVAVRVHRGVSQSEGDRRWGTTTTVLCSEALTLWRKGVDPGPCPSSFPFSVALPTTFSDERGSWSLPPTYEAHLTGMPGFTANVDYSVTAVASKTKNVKLGLGVTTVSTPFIYYPRTRPSIMVPPRLEAINSSPGLRMSSNWRVHESLIAARIPGSSPRGVVCSFYTPASHVWCMRHPIQYHITFTGPAVSLATLLTYMPSRTGASPIRACSRIQLLRQTTVDVKNEYTPVGATSEMWRTRNIGEGSLHRTGDGPNWLSFAGEIDVHSEVTIGGFKAAGLWVKDCIVFSIAPPDPLKGPIGDMRCVIPIRLVTDPWSPAAVHSDTFVPQASPTPSEVHSTREQAGNGNS
ncbi:hypothetical protein B0F90DRAFT_1628688 [Multifurca ochricompacta]|uniref:Uncharacterized protein n=1 Tax=Multifurca ochricompacta TaxID=376703 RepID=A0AAD4M6H5_9AGAM|nr:hypothetical protein B0F90DRAFT_1628688 [Multifurca ochricompacta]